jgi:hypothetical protein
MILRYEFWSDSFDISESYGVNIVPVPLFLLSPRGSATTIAGTPLALLPEGDRAARVWFPREAPENAMAKLPRSIAVAVENRSTRTWPGFAPSSDRGVRWAVRWQHLETGAERVTESVAPLAYDLGPGETLCTTINPVAPSRPGAYRLTVGLTQAGQWFPDVSVLDSIAVVRPGERRGRATKLRRH